MDFVRSSFCALHRKHMQVGLSVTGAMQGAGCDKRGVRQANIGQSNA